MAWARSVAVGEVEFVPRDLADEVSKLPPSRVIKWFRSEDYTTHERLIGYVVEVASEEQQKALLQSLREKGMSVEAKGAALVIVYVSE